ncbi:LysE family translocator [Pseudoalteromonas sp. SG44-1]|uniref:LysE family translocator n=1 Tax=Pseudoalteromonas sp. SG44-1 TaxID=2760964 RepID=UPI0016048D63|nr:LysE family translocator [Pseudoalteromonas sp. SG44-1]MBB1418112.1 LysE family translocator [Pseudoalteromonas sp. SG44-1]
MLDFAVLGVFIPTFFFVSITPGMCMTLAMTLGMSIGVRRTMWMMIGELLGVAIVAVAAVAGVASIMLNYPTLFNVLKWLGAGYLVYIGISMWRAKATIKLGADSKLKVSRQALFSQGFITAIAPQLSMLVAIIMLSEFTCMMLYATGGKSLRLFLNQGDNIKWMNRIAGSLMIAVGIWLAVS